MKREYRKRWIVACVIAMCLAAGIGGCEWMYPEPDPPGDRMVVGVMEVGEVPVVELADGRTFPLDRLDDWDEYVDRFSPQEPTVGPLAIEPKDRPETVDLRPHQTPIRTQVGGTCVQFATTAAIGR